MANKLDLQVVSQEKKLFSGQVDLLTVPTMEGELTILPFHAPLFAEMDYGELRYKQDKEWSHLVVSTGFLHVTPDNKAIIIVDSATHARDISIEAAEAAIRAAKETMMLSENKRELILAEAAMRKAILEIRVAQRTKKTRF